MSFSFTVSTFKFNTEDMKTLKMNIKWKNFSILFAWQIRVNFDLHFTFSHSVSTVTELHHWGSVGQWVQVQRLVIRIRYLLEPAVVRFSVSSGSRGDTPRRNGASWKLTKQKKLLDSQWGMPPKACEHWPIRADLAYWEEGLGGTERIGMFHIKGVPAI